MKLLSLFIFALSHFLGTCILPLSFPLSVFSFHDPIFSHTFHSCIFFFSSTHFMIFFFFFFHLPLLFPIFSPVCLLSLFLHSTVLPFSLPSPYSSFLSTSLSFFLSLSLSIPSPLIHSQASSSLPSCVHCSTSSNEFMTFCMTCTTVSLTEKKLACPIISCIVSLHNTHDYSVNAQHE